MVKKDITYTNYNDVVVTEPFYFNLTKAELLEMELTQHGGFQGFIKLIIDAKDQPTIIRLTKELLLKSYGEKTPDGKRLMKSAEISHNFECCPAYEIMFMMLATDDEEAAKFINALIPVDLRPEVKPAIAEANKAAE